MLGGTLLLYVGIDTGGTFTDLVMMDDAGGVITAKAPTTPGHLEEGVFAGLRLLAAARNQSLEALLPEVGRIGYGTTQATNALIERKGAKTWLITTQGFADTIFIQRIMGFTAAMQRERLGMYCERRYPDPIVPRTCVREVPERIDQAGKVLLPLDEAAVRSAVREALDAGAEAIAVSLLWSFRNPVHEIRIREIIYENSDRVLVSLSSEVSPVIGEYERTASTVFNAYLGPSVRSHFQHIEKMLCEHGFRGAFAVLNSIGGVLPAKDAVELSVLTVLSGPTGGVTGSRYLAESLGHSNVITSDMGGTSFDASLIINGSPPIALGRQTGGYHLSVPMIDIRTIGSGGGSIVSVHDGLIQVGPESAAASPGPVCYGRGGTLVTVTDADIVLGIIDQDNFLGGSMKLDRDAAEHAIRLQIAEPLGIGVEEAAAGIRRIVESQMADLLREVTIGRGHDPRNFVLYAYGGAGPTHCAGYGRELGVRQIVVPSTCMVHSAYGALASDTLYSAERSRVLQGKASGEGIDPEVVEAEFQELERQCTAALAANGFSEADRALVRFAEMRYRMQTHELMIPVPPGRFNRELIRELVARFERAYEETYGEGAGYSEAGIEIETFRVEGLGRTLKPAFAKLPAKKPAKRRERLIYLDEAKRRVPVTVAEWSDLTAGEQIDGPAVVEHPSTTVFIANGQRAVVDAFGNLIVEQRGSAL
jgi:N-methylhydantoinase A